MPGPVSSVYAFGPYRLDVHQRTLTHEHRPVALQPKTFDLLHLLVSNPGRAFSKKELWAGNKDKDASACGQVERYSSILAGHRNWIQESYSHVAANLLAFKKIGWKREISPLFAEIASGKRALIIPASRTFDC